MPRRGRQWLNDARSALVAGVVAAAIAYVGVVQTINAEDARSSAEFLRDKQQAAYAEFLTEDRTFQRLAESFYLGFNNRLPTAVLEEQSRAIDESYLKLSQYYSNVELLGSPEVAPFALVMEMSSQQVSEVIGQTASTVQEIPADARPEDVLEFKRQFNIAYDDYRNEIEEVRHSFIERARGDLGAPPVA